MRAVARDYVDIGEIGHFQTVGRRAADNASPFNALSAELDDLGP